MKKWLCLLVLLNIVLAANAWGWGRGRRRYKSRRYRKPVAPPPPCTPVDGTWSDWSEVKACPTCDSSWRSIHYGNYSMRKRFCKGRECGGKWCEGPSVETGSCLALPIEDDFESALGDWEVTQNCTGIRYEPVEKTVTYGWFWRKRTKTVTVYKRSFVTCNATDDLHSPKIAHRWLYRKCVNSSRCGGCPPWIFDGEKVYERCEQCKLPQCEEPTTKPPDTPTPINEETPTPEKEKPTTEEIPTTEIITEEEETPTPEVVIGEEETPTPEVVIEEEKTPTPEVVIEEEKTPTPEVVIEEETPTPGLEEPIIQPNTEGSDEPIADRGERSVGGKVPEMLEEYIENEINNVEEVKAKVERLLADLKEAKEAAKSVNSNMEDEQAAEESVKERVITGLEKVEEIIEEELTAEGDTTLPEMDD